MLAQVAKDAQTFLATVFAPFDNLFAEFKTTIKTTLGISSTETSVSTKVGTNFEKVIMDARPQEDGTLYSPTDLQVTKVKAGNLKTNVVIDKKGKYRGLDISVSGKLATETKTGNTSVNISASVGKKAGSFSAGVFSSTSIPITGESSTSTSLGVQAQHKRQKGNVSVTNRVRFGYKHKFK